MRRLKEQGLLVWDVSRGESYATLIAFDPERKACRKVVVCVAGISAPPVSKLRGSETIGVELWHRQVGESSFSITKL